MVSIFNVCYHLCKHGHLKKFCFFLLLAAVVQLAENKSVLEMAMLLCSQVCQLCSGSHHLNLSVSSPSIGCFT